jgi:hypothetical protein
MTGKATGVPCIAVVYYTVITKGNSPFGLFHCRKHVTWLTLHVMVVYN